LESDMTTSDIGAGHAERPPDASYALSTRDGFALGTDVYLPTSRNTAGNRGRHGTVVIRLPYGKRGPVATLPWVASYVTDRGWAFVAQDVRGKFDSTGQREAFVHEIVDGHDTLEWIIEQSWSDGRTIVAGDSYYGYTAWAAVASGHRSVRGVMARVTSPSVRTDWMYQQGVFRLGNMAEWAASTWMGSEWDNVTLDWSAQSHHTILPAAFDGATSADLDNWATRHESDPWWGARDLDMRRLNHPIVAAHVGGWWDLMSRGQLSTWRTLRAASPQSVHLLYMDDVDHVLDPVLRPGSPIIDVMADPLLRAERLPVEVQPLLDVIDIVDAQDGDGVNATATGAQPNPIAARWKRAFGGWEDGDQWPPRNIAPLTLYLGDATQATRTPEGGSLTAVALDSGAVSWLHQPKSPVPTVEKDLWRPLMSDADHRTNHERDDVATFTTPPFNDVLDITGPVVLNATTRADAPVAHLMVSLCHIWPDGTASEIVEGAALVRSYGTDVEITVSLGEIAYRLEPGTRLRLAIAGSSYPKYVLNPGTEEHPWTAVKRVPVRHVLQTGVASTLRLFRAI
jgi:uncharacterized protein